MRQFSSTVSLQRRVKVKAQPTRQRRLMYYWLATTGSVFKSPLPGSTNYLSAYDSQGQLKRLPHAGAEKQGSKKNDSEEAEGNELENKQEDGQANKIPPESLQDLRPFPLNRDFRSQPVLGEELREVIWSKVMKDGQSVATVSAELGVDMHRVGAVVRLKEVEKEWIRKVSLPFFRSPLPSRHLK